MLRSSSLEYNRYSTTTYNHGTNMPFISGTSIEPGSPNLSRAFVAISFSLVVAFVATSFLSLSSPPWP
jgi:hypothetical protein